MQTVRICLLVFVISPLAWAQIQFTDVTAEAGLASESRLLQSAAWADFDDDGLVDLYVTGRGANLLFLNNGDGTFTESAAAAGVVGPDTQDGDGIGVAFGDLDNDGDLDLFVSQINEGTDQLYRNDGPSMGNTQFVFSDIAAQSGTIYADSARGMTLFDYNRDGLLDIYVLATGPNALFENQGDWQFVDRAAELGVNPGGRNVGVVATDLNLDGWPDLFVANRSNLTTNLYFNRNGTFTNESREAGIDAFGLGMGVVSFDYDNDLDFDLYWTTWPGDGAEPVTNRLYANDGTGKFTDMTSPSDTADALGWGISANTADIDNDGWMDLFVTNGFDESSTPSILLRNTGDGGFEDVTQLLANMPADGRGIAFADYDSDGDQDVLLTAATDGGLRLWRNDSINNHRWLQLNLRGSNSNHTAVGARVVVTTDVGSTTQELHGSTGRGNQNEPRLHFGLGSATQIQAVTVHWPSGQVQILENPELDSAHTIFEAGAQPRQYSGAWYGGPGQAGHGFSIEELADNRFVVFWYTFDQAGNRTWLVSQGVRRGNVMFGDAYTIDGGQFPPDFDEAATARVEWGTLNITFDTCNRAQAEWTTDQGGFSGGAMDLYRLSTVVGAPCG